VAGDAINTALNSGDGACGVAVSLAVDMDTAEPG
jgi:hypothetical protein